MIQYPPPINIYDSMEQWIEENRAAFKNALCIAADNVGTELTFKASLQEPHTRLVIAIGSERGFSGDERDKLSKSGFLRAALGERALRTETACIAACALASC
ncbi:MAG: hypothetical protein Ta2G_05870 [Termitinemataceae bacterium]|nr:MAG: hypothetical protein Ta2G_05870 [Termitinemataceae bacterium]